MSPKPSLVNWGLYSILHRPFGVFTIRLEALGSEPRTKVREIRREKLKWENIRDIRER